MGGKLCKVYLYKITFEEVPYFYYGIHKEKKDNSKYMGSPIKNKWAWKMYTPIKEVLQVFFSWEEALLIEKRIIRYFLNSDPNCLNACAGQAFTYEYGERHHCYGKNWWNDGENNMRSEVCPGEKWVKGKIQRSNKHKRGQEHYFYGKRWWNNGDKEVLISGELLSPWVPGRLKWGKKAITMKAREKVVEGGSGIR